MPGFAEEWGSLRVGEVAVEEEGCEEKKEDFERCEDVEGLQEMVLQGKAADGERVGWVLFGDDGIGKELAEVVPADEIGEDEDGRPGECGSKYSARIAAVVFGEDEGNEEPCCLPACEQEERAGEDVGDAADSVEKRVSRLRRFAAPVEMTVELSGEKEQHDEDKGEDERSLHAVDGLVEHQRAADGAGDEVSESLTGPGGEPAANEEDVGEVECEGRELGEDEESGWRGQELCGGSHQEHPEGCGVSFDDAGAGSGFDASGEGEGSSEAEGDGGVVPCDGPKAEGNGDLNDEGEEDEGSRCPEGERRGGARRLRGIDRNVGFDFRGHVV